MNINSCQMQSQQCDQFAGFLFTNIKLENSCIVPQSDHMLSCLNQTSTISVLQSSDQQVEKNGKANEKSSKELQKSKTIQKNKQRSFISILSRKQVHPSLLIPKTRESYQEHQEESSSANSCLQSIESNSYHCVTLEYAAPHYQLNGLLMPKLQSDVGLSPTNARQASKNSFKSLPKKPKKDHINTGHWTQDEHNTYLTFLAQYQDIMTSSMMKKTSKIFKQMSDLIGSRTPSQCRSHHQKFNPYALRGENGKRLPRNERSRAGRKRKNMSESSNQQIYPDQQQYNHEFFQYYQNQMYNPAQPNELFNFSNQLDVQQDNIFIQQQQQPAQMQYEQVKLEDQQSQIQDIKQSIAYTFEAFFQSPNFNPRKVSVDQNFPFSLNDPNMKISEIIQ